MNLVRKKWKMLVSRNVQQQVKEHKKSEQLMSKCSVSRKATKQEITTKHKKLTDSDIDIQVFQHWIDNLDSATKESFCSFAEETFSAIQVYLYAKFLGYDSSIVAVDLWLKEHFSKPDHLKVLLNEIEEMQEDIRKLRMDIENYAIKRADRS